MVATFGLAAEVTTSELSIESFFPANNGEHDARAVRRVFRPALRSLGLPAPGDFVVRPRSSPAMTPGAYQAVESLSVGTWVPGAAAFFSRQLGGVSKSPSSASPRCRDLDAERPRYHRGVLEDLHALGLTVPHAPHVRDGEVDLLAAGLRARLNVSEGYDRVPVLDEFVWNHAHVVPLLHELTEHLEGRVGPFEST